MFYITFKALKKRISNRDTDQSPLPGEEPQMASHTSESAINYESDEDFFVNEDVVQPNRHEVDSRVPVKWNIQRQVSMKDKSIPEKVLSDKMSFRITICFHSLSKHFSELITRTEES